MSQNLHTKKITAGFIYGLIIISTTIFILALNGIVLIGHDFANNTFLIKAFAVIQFFLSTILIYIIFTTKKETTVEYKIIENTEHVKQKKITKKDKTKEINQKVEKILQGLDENQPIEQYTRHLLRNIANTYDIVQGIMFVALKDKVKIERMVYEHEKEEYEKVRTIEELEDLELPKKIRLKQVAVNNNGEEESEEQKKKVKATIEIVIDVLVMAAGYALYRNEENFKKIEFGEGIPGQVALDKKYLYIKNVPKGYITVTSGLGEGDPKYLIFLPIVFDDKTIAVLEIASFSDFGENIEEILKKVAEKVSPAINKMSKDELYRKLNGHNKD